jgi:hypothetical protein
MVDQQENILFGRQRKDYTGSSSSISISGVASPY